MRVFLWIIEGLLILVTLAAFLFAAYGTRWSFPARIAYALAWQFVMIGTASIFFDKAHPQGLIR